MNIDPIRSAIAPYALAIKAGAVLLLVLCAFMGGCHVNAGRLADEKAAHKATKAAHAAVLQDLADKTRLAAAKARAASEQARKDRKAADAKFDQSKKDSDHEIAGLRRALRAGTVRVRPEFTCDSPGSAQGGASSVAGRQDADAGLREAREGAILDAIGDADAADRWIGWLQSEVVATRKACGVVP